MLDYQAAFLCPHLFDRFSSPPQTQASYQPDLKKAYPAPLLTIHQFSTKSDMQRGYRRTPSPCESEIEDVSDELVKIEYRQEENAQCVNPLPQDNTS
jgi:hypothetical protein